MLKPCILIIAWAATVSCVDAQERRDCESYARDYASIVAPRSGASTLRNSTNGYPTSPAFGAPRVSPNAPTEWSAMAPNQNAYRRGYDECMSGLRR